MQFNTYGYILAFLPMVVLGWYGLNCFSDKYARAFIIVASLLFYYQAGIESFIWFLISIVSNYIIIALMCRYHQRFLLGTGIILNISFLFYFKYLNFSITAVNTLKHTDYDQFDIILPLGISFYTFQQISYLVDCFRDNNKDRESFFEYLLYITYFPKIIMGPIVKRQEIIPQFYMKEKKRIIPENLCRGIQMFCIGLFKKVIIADTFARAVSWAWNLETFSLATSMDLFLVMIAYTFQIYFDFSGYSDMAIGSSLMLNIELPINFDSPYKALSIRDFWKRWHISLTRFFTEYVYIPLGGNRRGKVRTYINTFFVFLLSGIWHGANWTFFLWGGVTAY